MGSWQLFMWFLTPTRLSKAKIPKWTIPNCYYAVFINYIFAICARLKGVGICETNLNLLIYKNKTCRQTADTLLTLFVVQILSLPTPARPYSIFGRVGILISFFCEWFTALLSLIILRIYSASFAFTSRKFRYTSRTVGSLPSLSCRASTFSIFL